MCHQTLMWGDGWKIQTCHCSEKDEDSNSSTLFSMSTHQDSPDSLNKELK
ncbi:hypothetical protein EXN66_Car022556 [Channa argus]|nr:hypothetical protein EXN66_Car022556 [Channa argus]